MPVGRVRQISTVSAKVRGPARRACIQLGSEPGGDGIGQRVGIVLLPLDQFSDLALKSIDVVNDASQRVDHFMNQFSGTHRRCLCGMCA
jgi:hypothetical protein